MNNSQIRKYATVNFDVKLTGALLGEVDGITTIIQPNASLPDYMEMIVDKIRDVAVKIHKRGYAIDYVVVHIKDNKLHVNAKLLKNWIEVFDL